MSERLEYFDGLARLGWNRIPDELYHVCGNCGEDIDNGWDLCAECNLKRIEELTDSLKSTSQHESLK